MPRDSGAAGAANRLAKSPWPVRKGASAGARTPSGVPEPPSLYLQWSVTTTTPKRRQTMEEAIRMHGGSDSEINLSVHLAGDQIELIARKVAEILATKVLDAGELLPVSAAAEFLGVTPKTIRNMLSDGRLKRHGGPRRPLVARGDLDRLASPQATQPSTVPISCRRLSAFSASARTG